MEINRRDLLKVVSTSSVAAAGVVVAGGLLKPLLAQTIATPSSTKRGEMLYRTLGRTNEQVSLIGLGGHHIGRPKEEQEGIKLIQSAIDSGINFMDNCWDYHNGSSEIRMGKALQKGYREKVFLMSKIDGRTKKAAAQQIDESLKRLQTDRIDLMQHHEIIRMEDPDRIFAVGGAQEAMLEAQKAGKIRYIGFTGHKDPVVHLRMLEIAAQNNFRFDAVQLPLNVMDTHFRSFEKQVLPVLLKDGIGVLGMKALGDRIILQSKTVTPIECLHYVMNLPVATVITGFEKMDILAQAVEAARTFKPLSREQVTALRQRTAQAAAKGEYEKFKTSDQFDGTAKNPAWLG